MPSDPDKSSIETRRDMFASLGREAHVWYCNPQAIFDLDRLAGCRSVLSDLERKQEQRFHFKKDQRSYLVSHALVRKVLSMYVDQKPEDWIFAKGAHGKPKIIDVTGPATFLRFNLTHTANLSACVVTRECRCGIDAEYLERKNKLELIAKRMFADTELQTLEHAAESERCQHFFNFWTLREAYVKARGTGLGGSSKAFCFRLDDRCSAPNCKQAQIEYADSKIDTAGQWQFELFQPAQDHVMAVALKSAGDLKSIQWRFMEP